MVPSPDGGGLTGCEASFPAGRSHHCSEADSYRVTGRQRGWRRSMRDDFACLPAEVTYRNLRFGFAQTTSRTLASRVWSFDRPETAATIRGKPSTSGSYPRAVRVARPHALIMEGIKR